MHLPIANVYWTHWVADPRAIMHHTIRNLIRQGLEKLALALASIAVLGMVSIVAIIITSVIMRKFANSPLHITEEVVGLLLSVSLFLGLPMVTLKAKHVRVALLANMLNRKLQTHLQTIALIVAIGFFSWLIYKAIPWFEFGHRLNLKTETTRILLYPWMAMLPLSLSVTCAILLARLLGVIDRVEETEAEIKTGFVRHEETAP